MTDSEVDRVSAEQLYRLTRQDIEDGLALHQEGREPHAFIDSTRFDLLVDGARYPPKAIVGLAARRALGRTLHPSDFSGGESSSAFRLLWSRGFEVATKPMTVGGLDATFSVARTAHDTAIYFESRGPDRNKQYREGLEVILDRLAGMDAMLVDALIDSRATQSLDEAERRLDAGSEYPVRLSAVHSVTDLRLALTGSAAQTARESDSTGGGNPTKRLRLQVELPDGGTMMELATALGGQIDATSPPPTPFEFTPSAPSPGRPRSSRRAVGETEIEWLHDRMQKVLHERLVDEHGEESVASERKMASGRPADIIVQGPTGYLIYEIKTAPTAKDCVRQALGQLLEYAYWPGSPDVTELWVVGPAKTDAVAEQFVADLRSRFGLPVRYQQLSVHGS